MAGQEPAGAQRGDETSGRARPAEWLDLAASVVKVEVVTAQGDVSLAYCASMLDYENDRSKLLSRFTTSLTVFGFAWGAFESVAKIAGPPSVPKADRKDGDNSLVARVARAIRPIRRDNVYRCGLAGLRHRAAVLPEYRGRLPAGLGPVTDADAGEGIILVRRVRNKFTHGAAALPQRDDWAGNDSVDNQLVRLSCRMALLTIQMLVRVHFAGRPFDAGIYEGGSDGDDEHEIHSHLQTLHPVAEPTGDDPDEDEPDAAGASDDTAWRTRSETDRMACGVAR